MSDGMYDFREHNIKPEQKRSDRPGRIPQDVPQTEKRVIPAEYFAFSDNLCYYGSHLVRTYGFEPCLGISVDDISAVRKYSAYAMQNKISIVPLEKQDSAFPDRIAFPEPYAVSSGFQQGQHAGTGYIQHKRTAVCE